MTFHRKPYTGAERKLIFALDIGTTFSGISYSILEPGEVPEIKGVTRFPAQERVGGDSKIPTIIYYDTDGKVCVVGAEAVQEGVEVTAEEKGWKMAEWFKLHLCPKSQMIVHDLPPLPKNKTVVDLFADFLQYLYLCALTFIRDTHSDGVSLLASMEQRAEFILTHPNGWEGSQQTRLRKAAVRAGLVADTDDSRMRIHFVTEGEASLHFCIRNGVAAKTLQKEGGVLVVDAGGGTVDLSAYSQISTPEQYLFREIAPPDYIFQGSIFVTKNALTFLRVLLRNSSFAGEAEHIASCFDKTTKLRFGKNANDPQYIKFGRVQDKDLARDIRLGQLKLSGKDVATFFEPCISNIIQAIEKQVLSATKAIHTIFLVGGFAANDWLFSQLQSSMRRRGLELCRPDCHLNKAVADGAVSYYVDHFVAARISRHTFGKSCYVKYDPTDSEHLQRSSTVFVDDDGNEECIPNVFAPVLEKGTEVMEVQEFRQKFYRKEKSPEDFQNPMKDHILCYRGLDKNPRWIDTEKDQYTISCTVVSDISRLRDKLRPRRGKDGTIYFRMEYDVVLCFGLTELTAQVCWKEHVCILSVHPNNHSGRLTIVEHRDERKGAPLKLYMIRTPQDPTRQALRMGRKSEIIKMGT